MSSNKFYIKTFKGHADYQSELEDFDKIVNEWIERNDIFIIDVKTKISNRNSGIERIFATIKYQRIIKRKVLTEKNKSDGEK